MHRTFKEFFDQPKNYQGMTATSQEFFKEAAPPQSVAGIRKRNSSYNPFMRSFQSPSTAIEGGSTGKSNNMVAMMGQTGISFNGS